MMPTISDAISAYEQAFAWLPVVMPNAKFIAYLSTLQLVNYHDGLFTFEAPHEDIVSLMSRRSEKMSIQSAIAVGMPSDVQVRVEFILAWAAQP